MSDVASLELCRELYELSGWNSGRRAYYRRNDDGSLSETSAFDEDLEGEIRLYPLGYLLRRLPQFVELDSVHNGQLQMAHDDPEGNVECWLYRYVSTGLYGRAERPEDAACQLAIQLFKQGVLIKENDHARD